MSQMGHVPMVGILVVVRVPSPCRPTKLIMNSVTIVMVVTVRVIRYLMHGQRLS